MIYGVCEDKNKVLINVTDSGWELIKPEGSYSGYEVIKAVKCRKIGSVVYFKGTITFNIPAGALYKTIDVGIIPAGYRATEDMYLAIGLSDMGIANRAYVKQTGELTVTASRASTSGAKLVNSYLNFNYLVD